MHHRDVEFAVGDSVLLSSRHLNLPGSRKFKPRWVGPFQVTARIGRSSYMLYMQSRFSRVHPVFHVSLLKRHQPGGSSDAPPDPVEVDGELEYVVEAIVGHRGTSARRQYLIRWAGYDASEDMFLSEHDL